MPAGLLTTVASLVGSVSELGLVLQAGVGTLIGSLAALRAKRMWAQVDAWAITTAWTALAAAVAGVAIVAVAIARAV